MNALRYIRRAATTVISSSRETLSTQLLPLKIQRLPQQPSFPSTSPLYPNCQIQQRFMSKYVSRSMKKNLPLTTKRARKGFYKGKGCTTEGRLNSLGRFIVNPLKRLQLVVPSGLSDCRLKPYIASTASRFPPEERHNTVSA